MASSATTSFPTVCFWTVRLSGTLGWQSGDSFDNALAEIIGLFKTEVIHHAGPWRGLEDVEYATLVWVSWYNTHRLLEPLGYLPPAEYEAQYHTANSDLAELVLK